jgi:cysteine desulfurase
MSYLDSAASTKLHPEVLSEMAAVLGEQGGNPSSPHAAGRRARARVEDARDLVAASLGIASREIIFTSGATESNNLAIQGVAEALRGSGNHLVTSSIEHLCILESCARLERRGFEVTRLPVDSTGRIDPDDLRRAVTPRTILVSIQAANHEVGTTQTLRELRKAAGRILFHVDAAQALGKVRLDPAECDLLTISGHKIHGPAGTGGLWVRRGTPLEPILVGGGQEFERRAGTENVAGISGLARAVHLACRDLEENARRMEFHRERLLGGLERMAGVKVNGHPVQRTPHLLSLTVDGVDAEAAVLALDAEGVCLSTGSACASLGREPSPVLRAMGRPLGEAKSSLRVSVSPMTTDPEVDRALEIVPRILTRLRRAQPVAR